MEKRMGSKRSQERHRKAFFNFSGRTGRILATLCGVLAILTAGGVMLFGSEAGGSPQAGPVGPDVTYAAKTFQDGKARFYEYKTGDGVTIKYFVLKSSDGVIRAAFDACDVCWPAGKGYAQKGDFMVCRNCGRQFASIRVNEVTGGCNPGALKREISADKLVIKAKDILEGRKYFDFAKRG